MKKILVTAGAMLLMSAAVASADGINLSWTDCGTSGVPSLSFDCASNSGTPFTLIASFIPPSGVNSFVGIAGQVDISTPTATLPDWWKHGAGQCRGSAALSTSFDFTSGPFTCSDPYQGQAAGGYAYDVGFSSPNRARLRVQGAVPADQPVTLDSSLEYYGFKATINRTKSTSTGACAGCSTQACIVLNDVQLFQPLEVGFDPDITAPANSNFVTWQSATVVGCPQSTPTHSSSWGQLKSLYR